MKIAAEIARLSKLLEAKSGHYISLVLKSGDRSKILSHFPPKFPEVIAHHVTYHFGVEAGTELPKVKHVKVIGYAQDEHLEALVVEVDGKKESPDGRIFHITLSLDPHHRQAKDANKVVKSGWKHVPSMQLSIEPKLESFDLD